MTKFQLSKEFDILSIDIDGHDYHILKSLKSFNPKIVIIEYNPTIPNDISYIQPPYSKSRHGSSPKALIDLANSKDYTLVALTDTNLIFLKNKIYKNSNILSLDLDSERDDKDIKVNVFQGYDGEILFSEKFINLRWHLLKYDLSKFQLVPKILRMMREDYSIARKTIYILYKKYLLIKSKIYRND